MVDMSLKHLYGLMLIVVVAWLLIVAESYFFIAVIRPLGPNLHSGVIPSSFVKVVLTAGLGVVWVAVMFGLDTLYSRSKKKIPTSAS
jgi:hypothetical protein